MKKRILTIILLGCMMLGLVACGGTNNNNDTNVGNVENRVEEDKKESNDNSEVYFVDGATKL